jgi:MFS family permease
VADAVDRRRLLLGSSLTLWGCTGGLLAAALFDLASLPLLLGLVAVQAAGFAVASSTRGAIVPRVLPAELVPAATPCRSRPPTSPWCWARCWPG